MSLNRLDQLRSAIRSQIGILVILATLLTTVGCGAQKSSNTVDLSDSSKSTDGSSRLEIQVLNPLQLKRTAINEVTGNPERYAVDGELFESNIALERMLAGRTLCYSKLVNFEPYTGAEISATYTNATESKDGKTLQYLRVTRRNETSASSISFVCMKLNYKIRPEEMRAAFGTILRVVIL